MKKQEYYRLALNYIPFMCNPITYTVAISEPYEQFLARQKKKDAPTSNRVQLILLTPCTEEDYKRYRKQNPTNDGCYLALQKQDYSKFIKGE